MTAADPPNVDSNRTLPDLSAAVADQIGRTCRNLSTRQDDFLRELNGNLVGRVPDLSAAAPPDGRSISDRIGHATLWAVTTDEPPAQVVAALQQVGAQNAAEGFKTGSYTSVGHALLHAARDTYPGEWSGPMSSAWIGYFQWLSRHFQSGASWGRVPEQGGPRDEPGAPAAAGHGRRLDTGLPLLTAPSESAAGTPAASRGQHAATQPPAREDPEPSAEQDAPRKARPPLDDDDDAGAGFGHLMMSMTRHRRDKPRR